MLGEAKAKSAQLMQSKLSTESRSTDTTTFNSLLWQTVRSLAHLVQGHSQNLVTRFLDFYRDRYSALFATGNDDDADDDGDDDDDEILLLPTSAASLEDESADSTSTSKKKDAVITPKSKSGGRRLANVMLIEYLTLFEKFTNPASLPHADELKQIHLRYRNLIPIDE